MSKFNQVGEAVPMPGTPAFTMVVFNAADVPAGSVVYVGSKKAKEAPWYPPVPEGFGGWIEYDGKGMPVDLDTITSVLCRIERSTESFDAFAAHASYWNWSHRESACESDRQIVAYCVEK